MREKRIGKKRKEKKWAKRREKVVILLPEDYGKSQFPGRLLGEPKRKSQVAASRTCDNPKQSQTIRGSLRQSAAILGSLRQFVAIRGNP